MSRISIEEVIKTLIIAICIVIGVIYVFLQKYRATLIASTAIFVALLGTFAGMYVLNFSINMLTLFGMVLAIGLVVDDAIVVVENVERNIDESGMDRKQATIQAMNRTGQFRLSPPCWYWSVFSFRLRSYPERQASSINSSPSRLPFP